MTKLSSSTVRSGAGHPVVVLCGGDPVDPSVADLLPHDATVIAADSGLASADRLGLVVDLLIGDLDSVDIEALAAVRAAGIPVEQHPVDKDLSDLALAMDAALAVEPDRIIVVGGHGGRLDHLLVNATLLASSAYARVPVTALMGPATVTVVHGSPGSGGTTITGTPDATVSLLAMHGDAIDVTTHGLRFGLDGDTLRAGSSRGLSNRFLDTTATIRLHSGSLLVVQPGDINPR